MQASLEALNPPGRQAAARPVAAANATGVSPRTLALIGAFMIGHVVLAAIMRASPFVGTLHALACAAAGAAYALVTPRIRRVAFVVAYIAASEVLWRMTKADVFYEFGKYTIIVILMIAAVRVGARRNRGLALLYLGFLLPSVALTFLSLDLGLARQQVGFNMSGPVAITMSILFFSNIRLTRAQMRGVFVAILGPATGIASISLIAIRTTENLEFENSSNFVTSGGFGPNQVSAVLGLAVMLLLLLALQRTFSWRQRAAALAMAAGFATLTALTFSRGGLAIALAGTSGAMFVLMRGQRRARVVVVMIALTILVLGKYVIEPELDEMTGGKFSERYSSAKAAGRDIYASSELEMFADHPLLGVGPGIGLMLRGETEMGGVASHTEYTRMLGEHGVFGLFSLLCFVLLAYRAVKDASTVEDRSRSLAFIIWGMTFLAIYATRIAAPAIILGLAFVRPPPSAKA